MATKIANAAPRFFLEIDPTKPVRQQTYDLIRQAIVTTKLPPGAAISEYEIGSQIGVSRTPVREAMVRLIDEGLVEVRPRIGTFVTRLRSDEIRQAIFLRDAVESAAARLAAKRLTPQWSRRLRSNLNQQEKAWALAQYDRVYELDEDFHHLIFEISGNPAVWKIVKAARVHMARLRNLSVHYANPVPQHREVFDAIERGDGEEAASAMGRHIAANRRYEEALLLERPELFEKT
ncbi:MULTISPECIES: GntR family transcriptional regulator [unclassified Mesorhizobium]|uniref:GntR family transcriptional regulator n=1 Tax=unclassified Mesorhizobium TaxID=325217 RepID=UPI0015E3E004|nr:MULTISPECIES: GntR family transcriptional regulator [unclassified Mesorhizobium]